MPGTLASADDGHGEEVHVGVSSTVPHLDSDRRSPNLLGERVSVNRWADVTVSTFGSITNPAEHEDRQWWS